MERFKVGELNKMLKMTGNRARLYAKATDSYIVYNTNKGIVKEYANGRKVPLNHDNHE